MKRVIIVLVLVALAVAGYRYFNVEKTTIYNGYFDNTGKYYTMGE